ncbi:MAG: hypothetical protein MJ170_02135 [Alphaproteobacteria bacterium]|nr:hypothetical protein [Alphaproteobacteria bacterium]
MKRLFLILCLIIICNTSYADIASVGYVDSVVAPIQDSISNIDSIKQDKLPNPPNNNGIYKLVWNGNTGQIVWEFEQYSLTCTPNTYDIGFSQCIDPTIQGSDFGFIDHNGSSNKASGYGLTENGTWGTTLYTGDKVTGIASCNSTKGTIRGEYTITEFSQSDTGIYCWCKMTEPAVSRWVFEGIRDDEIYCASICADACGTYVMDKTNNMRFGIFGSIGN